MLIEPGPITPIDVAEIQAALELPAPGDVPAPAIELFAALNVEATQTDIAHDDIADAGGPDFGGTDDGQIEAVIAESAQLDDEAQLEPGDALPAALDLDELNIDEINEVTSREEGVSSEILHPPPDYVPANIVPNE